MRQHVNYMCKSRQSLIITSILIDLLGRVFRASRGCSLSSQIPDLIGQLRSFDCSEGNSNYFANSTLNNETSTSSTFALTVQCCITY